MPDAAPLDFDLEIGEAVGGRYPVAVLESPAGEARATMVFPYDELALRNHLQAVTIALLSSGRGRRRVAPPEETTVQDFGTALFNAVFAGEVGRLYNRSRADARATGVALRIKLRCRAPDLSVLPWEFLYDPSEREYLCLSRQTPLVRYLEVASPMEPLRVELPLRILGVVASPRNLPELDTEREKQRVDEALAPLVESGAIEMSWLPDATWRSLQQRLNRERWHVFHFVGHGEFDERAKQGVLAFCDEEGNAHRLGARDLGMLLGDHHTLRLAVLNSCEGARAGAGDVFSSTAAELVRRGTPGVVAMQYMITDLASIELGRSFYDALAHGLPVDAALAEARKAICLGLTGSLEWGTPVLFMRTPDGVLFDVATPPPPVPSRAVPSPPVPSPPVPPEIASVQPVAVPTPREPRGSGARWRRPALAALGVVVVALGVAVALIGIGGDNPPPVVRPCEHGVRSVAGTLSKAAVPKAGEACADPTSVDDIQKQLNTLECYVRPGPKQVDGNFRDGTEDAVKRFQTWRGLPADGRVDATTKAAIYAPSPAGVCVTASPGNSAISGGGASPTASVLREPQGIGLTVAGDLLIVDNVLAQLLRVAADGTVTVLADSAQLSAPWTVTEGPGKEIYVGNQGPGGKILRIVGDSVVTVAKDLPPQGMAVSGDTVYVTVGDRIVAIEADGRTTTFAGSKTEAGNDGDGGLAEKALFEEPNGLAVHDGYLYVAGGGNQSVRRISLEGRTVEIVVARSAGLSYPTDVGFDSSGTMYILDNGEALWKWTPADGLTTVVDLPPGDGGSTDKDHKTGCGARFEDFVVAPDGTIYLLDCHAAQLLKIRNGNLETVALKAAAGGS